MRKPTDEEITFVDVTIANVFFDGSSFITWQKSAKNPYLFEIKVPIWEDEAQVVKTFNELFHALDVLPKNANLGIGDVSDYCVVDISDNGENYIALFNVPSVKDFKNGDEEYKYTLKAILETKNEGASPLQLAGKRRVDKDQAEKDEAHRKWLAEYLSEQGCPESVCSAPLDKLMKCEACVSRANLIKNEKVLLDFPRYRYVRWENEKFVEVENGKLVVEHEGIQYRLLERGLFRDLKFVAPDGIVNNELTRAFRKLRAEEEAKHFDVVDHWWESAYSMAYRAMENMGVKIVEYEPEISPTYDVYGEMILY